MTVRRLTEHPAEAPTPSSFTILIPPEVPMHSMGPVRVSRAVVLIIVAALSLSACSARTPASGGGGSSGTGVFGGQASAPVAPDEVLGVKKDPTTWSLPFDRVYGGSLLRVNQDRKSVV